MNPTSIEFKFTYKFLKALKKLNHKNNTPNHRTIKRASDWSLAAAVGPKKAWTRAILRRIRKRTKKRSHGSLVRGSRGGKRNNGEVSKTYELRELVPGAEEMDMCKLLSETAHYIKCLTTQVKVMKSIADLCST